MNIYSALVVTFFPVLILCSSFSWNTKATISNPSYANTFTALPSSNGLTHIFWISRVGHPVSLMYQVLLPDGTLTGERNLTRNTYLNSDTLLSAQSSDDGMHILLVFEGPRVHSSGSCYTTRTDGCYEVYLIESFNGGIDWSDAIRMRRKDMNDAVHRSSHSMLFEKDTGRIYIMYYITGDDMMMSIREPNKDLFELEYVIQIEGSIKSASLGFTVNRADSTRYLHMLWSTHDYTLVYSSSTDKGKTWTKPLELVEDADLGTRPAIAIDTQAAEGGIYAQYYKNKDVRIMWSINHGKMWEDSLRSGSDNNPYNSLGICGIGEKAILFSANPKFMSGVGFVRYLHPYSKYFTSLTYPFSPMSATYRSNSVIKCSYMGKDEYSVVFMVLDLDRKIINLAQGILSEA